MGTHTDALADLIRDSITDSEATREDWEPALNLAFDATATAKSPTILRGGEELSVIDEIAAETLGAIEIDSS